ncbi:MAG: hypothetical protein JJE52_06240 [Acidimicrobiia bacterium]|nr:hypothetical protein [Acidimicrobiia bacterium]
MDLGKKTWDVLAGVCDERGILVPEAVAHVHVTRLLDESGGDDLVVGQDHRRD